MLQGVLVDLVPHGKTFNDLKHKWENSEAGYWASAGDRKIVSRAALRRWQEQRAERHGPGLGVGFGVQTKDGTPIGDFGIGWVVPHHRIGMLGAMIGEPDYWGGGYGTDALLLIVEYAFAWLDMRKLWLGTMGLNVRVHRQMEKVGFRREAVRRELFFADGQRTDEVIYGMLRDEWPGREVMVERLGLRARAEGEA